MTTKPDYTDEDVLEALSRRAWDNLDPDDGLESADPELESAELSDPKLWFPSADRSVSMPTKGFYPAKYPVGALVHFTASPCDRGDPDAVQIAKYGATKNYSYFCISRTGKVYQTSPLSRWGNHSGRSTWPGLGDFVHRRIVGIEVLNAGGLKKTDKGYEPWWNEPGKSSNRYYQEEDVRHVEKRDNVLDKGVYQRYSPEQEKSLVDLILWMHETNPEVFKLKFVVGHDEVSPNRKNDPGGSLSTYMPAFREHLAAQLARRKQPVADVPVA